MNLNLPEDPSSCLEKLVLDEEIALIRKIGEFPSLIEEIASDLEPHRLTYYLIELASSFHRYYNKHRVIAKDRTLSHARLCLSLGAKVIIKNGLSLLGLNAPEKM